MGEAVVVHEPFALAAVRSLVGCADAVQALGPREFGGGAAWPAVRPGAMWMPSWGCVGFATFVPRRCRKGRPCVGDHGIMEMISSPGDGSAVLGETLGSKAFRWNCSSIA